MTSHEPHLHTPVPATDNDPTDRTIAMLTHLACPIAMLVSAGSLPFLGPLVVWLLYKDKNPFVRQSAAGAFNFAINTTIVMWVGILLSITIILAPIGIPMILAAIALQLFCSIKGAMKANQGQPYSYPMQWLKLLS